MLVWSQSFRSAPLGNRMCKLCQWLNLWSALEIPRIIVHQCLAYDQGSNKSKWLQWFPMSTRSKSPGTPDYTDYRLSNFASHSWIFSKSIENNMYTLNPSHKQTMQPRFQTGISKGIERAITFNDANELLPRLQLRQEDILVLMLRATLTILHDFDLSLSSLWCLWYSALVVATWWFPVLPMTITRDEIKRTCSWWNFVGDCSIFSYSPSSIHLFIIHLLRCFLRGLRQSSIQQKLWGLIPNLSQLRPRFKCHNTQSGAIIEALPANCFNGSRKRNWAEGRAGTKRFVSNPLQMRDRHKCYLWKSPASEETPGSDTFNACSNWKWADGPVHDHLWLDSCELVAIHWPNLPSMASAPPWILQKYPRFPHSNLAPISKQQARLTNLCC
jgi:hypothetical protein